MANREVSLPPAIMSRIEGGFGGYQLGCQARGRRTTGPLEDQDHQSGKCNDCPFDGSCSKEDGACIRENVGD
jgi:hypothetical protein